MASIRAFIAVQLPEEVKAALEEVETRLKAGFPSAAAKWVAVPSIHLTLKFLGSVDELKTNAITVAIASAAEETPPFSLELGGLGAFPNMRKVDVVWVGIVGGLECLCQLQSRVEENMEPLGFRPEGRPFSPHLTLARLREAASREERQELGQLVSSTSISTSIPFKVDSVYLMRSQLLRTGPIYTEISHIRLSEMIA